MLKKVLVLSFLFIGLAGCAIFRSNTNESSAKVSLSYAQHIKPIMEAKCSPCHFPTSGKVEMLDSYEAVRKHFTDIIFRVKLNPEHKKYMPFKQKKPGLSPAEIAKFQMWRAEGFAE